MKMKELETNGIVYKTEIRTNERENHKIRGRRHKKQRDKRRKMSKITFGKGITSKIPNIPKTILIRTLEICSSESNF